MVCKESYKGKCDQAAGEKLAGVTVLGVSKPDSNSDRDGRQPPGLHTALRVRILKAPKIGDCDLQGFDVSRLEVGQIYDVGQQLGELLLACGYAEPETRPRDRAADKSPRRK